MTASKQRGAKAKVAATKTSKKKGSGKALRTVAQPKQARSEETLERLLDAAESLIKAKGLANVSIAALARKAGSSVGGFYARFKDKDEMLRTLHEREQRRFHASIAQLVEPAVWADQPLGLMIERSLHLFFARLEGRQKLAAAFLESAARNPEQWAHAIEFRRMVVDAFVKLLALRKEEIDHPDPEQAIRFAIHQVLATADHRALFAHMGGPDESHLSDAELRDQLTLSLCRYLGVDRG
ncbi:MAG: TetR/AcrR family transcriptional regulator [Deltaproteobacteria bacterium]|nr:TetR/AcrR family transcriptional regulator [Deltaproteobacteria bacterium]